MQHICCQYFLNHLLDSDEVRRQVREFAKAGYESLFAHSRAGLLTPYMSKGWFDIIDAMADEARKCGITLSIWDEDYYPSPTAGGRIVWDNPELMAQDLRFTVVKVKPGETINKLLIPEAGLLNCYAFPANGGEPIDITEYAGTVKTGWWHSGYSHSAYSIVDKIGSPHLRAGLTTRQFAVMWTAPTDSEYTVVACQIRRDGAGHGTDLLNTKAIDKFIQVTHLQYKNRYGDDFSKIFSASFLDEPAPSGPFQWTTDFPQEFMKDHGFDIVSKLAHLAVELDETSKFIRHCYRKTQHRLICSNYLERIRQWDSQNGILSIGHLTRTEYLSFTLHAWPNELRCYKYLDIPCTDPLGFYVGLPDACAYHTGMKVVSSAARLFNKQQCGSDALAVLGNETSLRDLAYQLDYQITFGATYYNIHGLNYSLDGTRKEETPPGLFYQHSEWPIMQHLLKPAFEKCDKVASGKPCERLALLYPSTSLYCKYDTKHLDLNPEESTFHKLSELLLSNQKDYDFVDEITLAERDGATWRKDYDAFLLYKTTEIDADAAAAIEDFQAQGGNVILIADELPNVLGKHDNPVRKWNWIAPFMHSTLDKELLATLPGIEVTSDKCGLEYASARDIFVQEREYAEGRRLLLFNRASLPFVGKVAGKSVTLPPGVARFADEAPIPMPQNQIDISSDWELTFPDNSIPLAVWLVRNANDSAGSANFLSRQFTNISETDERITYENFFLLQNLPSHAKLVIEESTFSSAEWQLFLNGTEITKDAFKKEMFTDCMNYTADITALLRGASSPLKNTVTVVCNSRNCRLQEMPFITGDFSAEYRHGLPSLPNLWADAVGADGVSPATTKLHALQDWRTLGRQSFSGCATYTKKVMLTTDGSHVLDCGRVEDAVELYLDGAFVGAAITPFYRFAFEAAKGEHTIELRVWNAPGNRDRLSNMPAGLLGPVSLG